MRVDSKVIRDRTQFEDHWTKDLNLWFKDGVDTPGLVPIKVHASRIKYWDGIKGDGELLI